MKINPDIFKAYDIRGKYPSQVNEEVAEVIGSTTAVFLSRKYRQKKLKILLCRDVRVSSDTLKDAISRGIITQGSEVIDAGIGTTPFFYFLMHYLKPDGGIMVTASHNPPEFNGFKIRGRGGKAIAEGTGLEKIKELASKNEIVKKAELGKIIYTSNYRDKYIDSLTKNVSIGNLRVIIDAAGGSTVLFLPQVLSEFPKIIYKPLFFEPDGTFKNHPSNPLLPESQKYIKEELESGSFQFGAIFDGDGDRIIFFDEKGNAIKPEFILGLFAEEELKKQPGSIFVMPVNASKGTGEFITELGGQVKLSRVGYTFMQKQMGKYKALMGAEVSGHFYFKEFLFNDSGILAWLKLASIISHTPRPLSQLIKPQERYVSREEINFPVKDKEKVVAKIKKYYKNGALSTVDGITIEFPEWWFNLRPSANDPVVRLSLEARTQELFDEKLKELKMLLTTKQ